MTQLSKSHDRRSARTSTVDHAQNEHSPAQEEQSVYAVEPASTSQPGQENIPEQPRASVHSSLPHPRSTAPTVNAGRMAPSKDSTYESLMMNRASSQPHVPFSPSARATIVSPVALGDGTDSGYPPPESSVSRGNIGGKLLRSYLEDSSKTLDLTFKLHEQRGSMTQQRDVLKSSTETLVKRVDDLARESAWSEEQLAEVHHLRDIVLATISGLRNADSDYDIVENELIQHEFETQRRYERVARMQSGEIFDSQSSAQRDDGASITSDNHIRADPSAEAMNYLSTLGDVDLLKEQLMDLRTERRLLVEEQILREKVGLSLDEESLVFLRTFDEQQSELQKSLDEAQAELDRLRDSLPNRDNELTDRNEAGVHELITPPTQHNGTGRGERPSKPQSELLCQIRPPEDLLLPELEPDRGIQVLLPESNRDVIETSDFVNAWLLHQLQRSPTWLSEYRQCLESGILQGDADRLKDLIQNKWFNDGSRLDFVNSRRIASRSILTNHGNTRATAARSESFIPTRSSRLPLLQLNPHISTNSIIARARRYSNRSVRSVPRGS